MGDVTFRRASLADVDPIMDLVNRLAAQQVMLPRSPASVIENVRDFRIAGNRTALPSACCQLRPPSTLT